MQFFQSLRFAGTLLVTIVLARSYFTLTQIGEYEYFVFLGALLLVPLSVGVKNAILARFKEVSQDEVASFFWSSYCLLFLIGLGIVALFGVYHNTIGISIKSDYIPLLLTSILLTIPSILTDVILLLRKSFHQIVSYSIGLFVLQVGIICLVIYLDLAFIYLLYYIIGLAVLKQLYLLLLLIYHYGYKLNLSWIARLFGFSIPLIGIALLNYGMEAIDGLLVRHYFSLDDFAIFRYGAKELPPTILLISGMVTALVPVASSEKDKTVELIRDKTSSLVHILYIISILLVLSSPILFKWVYGEAFLPSAMIFNVYLLTLSSRILIPQVFYLSDSRNQFLLGLSAVELLINFLLSLLLLSCFGIVGIALATWIAYLLHKIALLYFLNRDYSISISDMVHVPTYLGYNLILYLAFISVIYLY